MGRTVGEQSQPVSCAFRALCIRRASPYSYRCTRTAEGPTMWMARSVEGWPEEEAKKDKPLLSAPDVELDQPGNIARAVAHLRSLPHLRVGMGDHSDDKAYL